MQSRNRHNEQTRTHRVHGDACALGLSFNFALDSLDSAGGKTPFKNIAT